ncbi:MAG: hypothetical protein ABGZ23_06530 [Fuerstiella sp.]
MTDSILVIPDTRVSEPTMPVQQLYTIPNKAAKQWHANAGNC